MHFLDFEQPIADLEAKINELRYVANDKDLNISEEINRLRKKSIAQTEAIFSSLTPWQVTQLARHPKRPYTLDYIERIITDFEELHGGCHVADDPAIVCGLGRLGAYPVAVIGHQKGRDTKQRIYRNYGMPRPDGYRKALRVLKLSARFQLPVITFIDTPGAYPGIEAEERGQSEAIATNLLAMSELETVIIAVVIGEGGSGGALAIGVADYLCMLQYSVYSVISPEGCASILWKNAEKAEEAAKIMRITAGQLKEHGLIDGIIDEPLGGAHRDVDAIADKVKNNLLERLEILTKQDIKRVVAERKKKLRNIGQYQSD